MAQINTPKAFDKSLIDPDVLDKLGPFIEYTNQNFDQLIRAFFNQITFGDNVRGKFVTVTTKHSTPITIDVNQGISAVFPYRVSGDALKYFTLTTDRTGQPRFTPYFAGPVPVQTRSFVAASGFITTECNSSVSIGDAVSITGAGNQNNNGEFVVIGKLSAPDRIVYYNANGATESRGSYSGDQEPAKDITLFIFFA